ncbi:MAG: Transcriptional regulator, ROK family [uncultured Truepera sp.]|uniref:Transcriptional regulator, ROK family n=1 Tax=uncultured Truepera sp. TaxID=543023 RepID=A0A6J4VNV4_9DEIN|nr:MAG: Transcriptional regulator, ROK family [uncultured Truepera sp.]
MALVGRYSSVTELLDLLSYDERAVLRYLVRRKEGSRSEIARALNYSKTKSNNLVAALLACGLLAEGDANVSTQGRSASAVGLRADLACVLGIDLGATSVTLGLADSHRRLLGSRSSALDVRAGPTPCLSQITGMIYALLDETGVSPGEVAAIGMGVPGPVEFRTGLLIAPPIMPGWEGYSIRDHLGEEFGAAVFIDNDVNVMALGEAWNHSEGFTDAIFVKVGTGIGAGILCRGLIYRGADGSAGDIGHICADPQGPVCPCGNVGCLEMLAAGPAISKQAQAAAAGGHSDLLAAVLARAGHLTPQDVGKASREGDAAANAIIKGSGERIGQTLAALINFFNPERVIIGGGITKVGYLLLASIRHAIYQRSLPLSTRHLVIEYSQLGDVAGLIGAVALAWQELLKAPASTPRPAVTPVGGV